MADISQITLPDGTTYDIKDPVARAAAGDAGAGKIFYGVCSTASATQTKVVTIEDFELFTGALIAVKFDNVNTATSPKLNISGTGAINMYSVGTTAVLPNAWSAGETLLFVYNGTSYMVADGGIASTSGYGATKLNSSTSSTSTTEAATPSAVKSAYDLALEAKTSASDGKSLIASAITGKGVSTSATDTFATMADNIDNIQTGHTITIDGEEYDNDVEISSYSAYFTDYPNASLPTKLDNAYGFSLNGVPHYASGKSSVSTNYAWDGSNWVSSFKMPLYNRIPFVRKNPNTDLEELWIISTSYSSSDAEYGGTSSFHSRITFMYHNGTNWTSLPVQRLYDVISTSYPYFNYAKLSSPIIFNNRLYFVASLRNKTTTSSVAYRIFLLSYDFESRTYDNHYTFSTSSSSYVTNYRLFVYKGELYYFVITGSSDSSSLYKFNSSFVSTKILDCPFSFYNGSCNNLNNNDRCELSSHIIEFDKHLYILGATTSDSTATYNMGAWVFDGSSVRNLYDLNEKIANELNGSVCCIYNGKVIVASSKIFKEMNVLYSL